MFLSLKILKL